MFFFFCRMSIIRCRHYIIIDSSAVESYNENCIPYSVYVIQKIQVLRCSTLFNYYREKNCIFIMIRLVLLCPVFIHFNEENKKNSTNWEKNYFRYSIPFKKFATATFCQTFWPKTYHNRIQSLHFSLSTLMWKVL